mmetsp:Transcript_42282/g.122708  ORF Transcript_42282/g.122708 Transcript_42282/m.122708 type:complete len:458 (+) Transcript_42282:626-1999(+)
MTSTRLLVKTVVSRPLLKATTTCSSFGSSGHNECISWSSWWASICLASSPSQERRLSSPPGGLAARTSGGRGSAEAPSAELSREGEMHLADKYRWMAIKSTLSFAKSCSSIAIPGWGGSSPTAGSCMMSVQTTISESLSKEPADRTANIWMVDQGMLVYFTFLPDHPFVSTNRRRLVVNKTISRRPLKAISTRSQPCRIGGELWNCASTLASSICRASSPAHSKKLVGPASACPARLAGLSAKVSTVSRPRTMFERNRLTAMMSTLPLRRSCRTTRMSLMFVYRFSSASLSKPPPADSTEKARMHFHNKVLYWTFLPLKPLTSTSTMRFVVKRVRSRPHLKASSTFSDACKTAGSDFICSSICAASTCLASSPRMLQKSSAVLTAGPAASEIASGPTWTPTSPGSTSPSARTFEAKYLWMARMSTRSFTKFRVTAPMPVAQNLSSVSASITAPAVCT